MKHRCLVIALFLSLSWHLVARGQDPVFSGPQVGEVMPSFKAKGVLGDLAGKEFDLVKQADGKPILLMFVHQRTRPGFQVMNSIMKFAATRAKQGLVSGAVFLTDDVTATEQWVRQVQKNFAEGVAYGIFAEGVEGPGSYGLNRNMTLTILVGNKGKVTANFALVQPGLQADGPKILQAIVDVTGGGKVPTIAELDGGVAMDKRPTDAKLGELLRSVINKQATPQAVADAAAELEKYVAGNEAARKELGRIATTITTAGKLDNYGTKPAQDMLRKWAKEYGTAVDESKKNSKRE